MSQRISSSRSVNVSEQGETMKMKCLFHSGADSKSCVICKAPARSLNFGAQTCDPCKSFFRRSQAGASKTYRCVNGFNCIIDIDGRKSCSYCRYQRCLAAGMSVTSGTAAKIVQDKIAPLTKTRSKTVGVQGDLLELAAQELYQELTFLTSRYVPSIEDKSKFFKMIEIFDLDTLWGKFTRTFYNIPIRHETKINADKNLDKTFEVISVIGQRLFLFANSIPQFTELGSEDRKILFRSGCAELCMMNGVLTFDRIAGVWCTPMNRDSHFYKNVPGIDAGILLDVLGTNVHSKKVELIVSVQHFHPDEMIIMLLFAILLFTPNRPGVSDRESVRKSQAHFFLLLKKYLLWRFGESQGGEVFTGLIGSLKSFRRIGSVIFQKIHEPILSHPTNNLI